MSSIIDNYSTESSRIGTVVNTLDHPVYISYDGETIIIPSKGKTSSDIDFFKLGALPAKVVFVPNEN